VHVLVMHNLPMPCRADPRRCARPTNSAVHGDRVKKHTHGDRVKKHTHECQHLHANMPTTSKHTTTSSCQHQHTIRSQQCQGLQRHANSTKATQRHGIVTAPWQQCQGRTAPMTCKDTHSHDIAAPPRRLFNKPEIRRCRLRHRGRRSEEAA
jgi:hypothetical protein